MPAIDALAWARVRAPKEPALPPLVADLGPGEREALALARESPGSLVILDDGLARRYAAHLGLRLIGTLGILVRAKRQGLIPAVASVLHQLDRLRFRVDPATRQVVLVMSGEIPCER